MTLVLKVKKIVSFSWVHDVCTKRKKKKTEKTIIRCLLRAQDFIQQQHCEIWCNTGFIWKDVTVGGNDPLSFICIQVNLINTAQGEMYWKPTTQNPNEDVAKLMALCDWHIISGKSGAEKPKRWPLSSRHAASAYILRPKNRKDEKSSSHTVCPGASSACFHGNYVPGNANMSQNLDISTYTHTSIYCAYTLFHFLTSTFFFSHTETHFSLLRISLSPFLSLSASPTHNFLSLSRFLSACHPLSVSYLRTKRLVSRQVLRPIKLSTPVVDLKDADTQSALGQRAQRYVVTERDWRHQQHAHSDFTPTQVGRETCNDTQTQTMLLKSSKSIRPTLSLKNFKCRWQWWLKE